MTPGRVLMRCRFGSHLYGTSTPQSDLDYKSVYVPEARQILLGRVKGSISTQRPKWEGEKNFAGEVEEEAYSLQRYLGLLAEGQTVSLDILFTPKSDLIVCDPVWTELIDNRHRMLTRKSAAFVGYCRAQANKYGIKGSRVAAARAVLSELEHGLGVYGTVVKLSALDKRLRGRLGEVEHVVFVEVPQVSGGTVTHVEVCGRKLPYTASIKNAYEIVRRLVDEYGHRALQAESQQGVDWKALSHAVRIARQAVELFDTGNVTFPRPEAEHLLTIKTGQVLYKNVAEEIEQLLSEVEEAAERSSLPDQPDIEWMDDFVAAAYRQAVISECGRFVREQGPKGDSHER